jgi:hypothetical protein
VPNLRARLALPMSYNLGTGDLNNPNLVPSTLQCYPSSHLPSHPVLHTALSVKASQPHKTVVPCDQLTSLHLTTPHLSDMSHPIQHDHLNNTKSANMDTSPCSQSGILHCADPLLLQILNHLPAKAPPAQDTLRQHCFCSTLMFLMNATHDSSEASALLCGRAPLSTIVSLLAAELRTCQTGLKNRSRLDAANAAYVSSLLCILVNLAERGHDAAAWMASTRLHAPKRSCKKRSVQRSQQVSMQGHHQQDHWGVSFESNTGVFSMVEAVACSPGSSDAGTTCSKRQRYSCGKELQHRKGSEGCKAPSLSGFDGLATKHLCNCSSQPDSTHSAHSFPSPCTDVTCSTGLSAPTVAPCKNDNYSGRLSTLSGHIVLQEVRTHWPHNLGGSSVRSASRGETTLVQSLLDCASLLKSFSAECDKHCTATDEHAVQPLMHKSTGCKEQVSKTVGEGSTRLADTKPQNVLEPHAAPIEDTAPPNVLWREGMANDLSFNLKSDFVVDDQQQEGVLQELWSLCKGQRPSPEESDSVEDRVQEAATQDFDVLHQGWQSFAVKSDSVTNQQHQQCLHQNISFGDTFYSKPGFKEPSSATDVPAWLLEAPDQETDSDAGPRKPSTLKRGENVELEHLPAWLLQPQTKQPLDAPGVHEATLCSTPAALNTCSWYGSTQGGAFRMRSAGEFIPFLHESA